MSCLRKIIKILTILLLCVSSCSKIYTIEDKSIQWRIVFYIGEVEYTYSFYGEEDAWYDIKKTADDLNILAVYPSKKYSDVVYLNKTKKEIKVTEFIKIKE